ncbi:MAG: hypothetical protein ACX930_14010 [Erythrobacter sp.]
MALTHSAIARARQYQADILSSAIALGCGMALIMAGKALPL